MDEIYSVADIFINTNDKEIYGMSILEAMYCGCPVVAKRAPGPEFIVDNGQTGYVIDNYNKQIWYEKINDIVLNRELFGKNSKLFCFAPYFSAFLIPSPCFSSDFLQDSRPWEAAVPSLKILYNIKEKTSQAFCLRGRNPRHRSFESARRGFLSVCPAVEKPGLHIKNPECLRIRDLWWCLLDSNQ